MKLHKSALVVCRASVCLTALAVNQVFAQYQRTWTVGGWLDRRDYAADITLDGRGNLYVGGETEDVYGTPPSGKYSGAIVAKLNAAGTREWLSNAYSAISLDHVADIAVDASNNVFIAGETYRYAAGAESFLVKFSGDGTRLWERHLGTPDNEFGLSLAVDRLGNAYVGGSTTGDLTGGGKHGYDPFIAKYDTNGALAWLRQYADPALNPYPESMSISPGHGIYLGFGGTIDGGLARLDEAGQLLWFQKPNYSSAPSLHTDIYGVTSDTEGSVYAAGISNFAYTNGSGFIGGKGVVAKHGIDGALIWSQAIPTISQSSASDVTLDSQGNIYICGGTSRVVGGADAGDTDAFWAKFSPTGNLLWFETWGTEFSESASGLAVDQAGRVFVVATQFRTVNGDYAADGDVSVIRFDPVPEPPAVYLVATMTFAWAMFAATRQKSGRQLRRDP
jgi:hypothetical protein